VDAVDPHQPGAAEEKTVSQWEYTQVWTTNVPARPQDRDATTEVLAELNRFGAEGWEVCAVLEYPHSWLVLLKRQK
jgi:hypothetical protein